MYCITIVAMLDETMIAGYCNRLIRERRISLSENLDQDGRIMYSVKFYQSEWFSELNDDLQYCIVANIQKYLQENIISILSSNHEYYQSIDRDGLDTIKKRKFGEF